MNELGHQAHPEPWPQLPDTGHIPSSLPGDWFVFLALPLSEAKLQLLGPGTEPPVWPSSMNKEVSSHRAGREAAGPALFTLPPHLASQLPGVWQVTKGGREELQIVGLLAQP